MGMFSRMGHKIATWRRERLQREARPIPQFPTIPRITIKPTIKPKRKSHKRTARSVNVSLETQTAQDKPIPVIYGETVTGNRCFAFGKRSNGNKVFGCLVGWGEIEGYVAHYVNDKPIPGDIIIRAYRGTTSQGIDPGLQDAISGYDDNLVRTINGVQKGIAYVVYEVPGNSTNVKGFPRFSCRVRGCKEIYDPRSDSTGYSDNPALCFAHWLSSNVFGPGWTINEDSIKDAANACDYLVGGEKKRIVGLVLDREAGVWDWVETWRTYAGLLPLYQDDGEWFFVADKPRDSIGSLDHSDGIFLEGSFSLQKDITRDKPTVVVVRYTDLRTNPAKEATAKAQLPSVETGDLPRIVSEVSLPGITRYSQAYREAVERLNAANLCDLRLQVTMDESGIKLLPGDVYDVSIPLGLNEKPMQVLAIDNTSPGRYKVTLQEYDPARFSSDIETAPTYPDYDYNNGVEVVYATQVAGDKPPPDADKTEDQFTEDLSEIDNSVPRSKYAYGRTLDNLLANQVPDPNFSKTSADDDHTWWIPNYPDEVEWGSTIGFAGSAGMQVIARSDGNTVYARAAVDASYLKVATIYNDQWFLRFRAKKSSDFNGNARLYLFCYDKDGQYLSARYISVSSTNLGTDWDVYGGTVDITNSNTAYIHIAFGVSDATQGSVTFDDILMRKATTWDAEVVGPNKPEDNATYGADLATNVNNRYASYITETTTRKWAGESGADITGNHTANNTTYVNDSITQSGYHYRAYDDVYCYNYHTVNFYTGVGTGYSGYIGASGSGLSVNASGTLSLEGSSGIALSTSNGIDVYSTMYPTSSASLGAGYARWANLFATKANIASQASPIKIHIYDTGSSQWLTYDGFITES